MRIKFLVITAVLAIAILSIVGFVKVQADNPPVTGICSASGDLSQPGGSITWTATAGGGDGNYTYYWNGSDNLSGTAQTATQTYLTAGRKEANVIITSSGVSKTVTCYASVGSYPAITATCSPSPDGTTTPVYINDTVTWTATATGGNGTFTYSWSGTGPLTGDAASTTRAYTAKGKKTAKITVTSNGVSKSASCYVNVSENIPAKIECVAVAVGVRELALGMAMTTYTTSLNSAYSARVQDLGKAYNLTTLADVKSAVKTAWDTFRSSKISARTAWQTARKAAWATYRTTAIACGAPVGTGDGIKSGFEVVGQ